MSRNGSATTQGSRAALAEGINLHLAERDPQHHGWPSRGVQAGGLRLRILLSYHYYRDTDLDALFKKYFTEPYPEVFADSGAFSAMTQGVGIDVDEYAAWVKRWQHHFSVYANLDVIKDADSTWRNQCILEDRHDLQPLPVFHVAEDWSWLDRYIDQYPYIALGVAGTPASTYWPWLVRCFKTAQGRAVFHGFGITTWQVLKDLPWYSADSSSWGQGFRFGAVPVFDESRGTFVKLRLGDGPAWIKASPLVHRLGFDPADFAIRARNDRAKICAISALSYMLAERWLRQRHGPIAIPTRDDRPVDPLAYLADANPARFGDAVRGAGVRLHLADTSNGINYRDADAGLKVHLSGSPKQGDGANDLRSLAGLNLHLAYAGDNGNRDLAALEVARSAGEVGL